MAETWVSVDKAAGLFGCSTRTMYRHVKQGVCQTRMTPDGKREVLVDDTPDTLAKTAERSGQLAAAAIGTSHELAAAYKSEAVRWRRVALVGWFCTFALGLVIMSGGWFWVYRLATSKSAPPPDNRVADAQNGPERTSPTQTTRSCQKARGGAYRASCRRRTAS